VELTASEGVVAKTLLAAGIWAATGTVFQNLLPPPKMLDSDDFVGCLVRRSLRDKTLPMLLEFATAQTWHLGQDAKYLCEVFKARSSSLYTHLDPILAELAVQQVEVMAIKGADLAISAYPGTLTRMMNDIDILVKPPDLDATVGAFRKAGYIQAKIDRDSVRLVELTNEEKASACLGHYELPPFLRIRELPGLMPFIAQIDKYLSDYIFMILGDQIYCAEAFDVHFNLSADIELRDLWDAPRQVTLPSGRVVLAQAASDLLWILSARAYHEMMQSDRPCMRLFIDVLAVIHAHRHAIDWSRVMAMTRKYDLHPGMYYVLWHAKEFLGEAVPDEVCEYCDPAGMSTKRYHDWGDFAPKILGYTAISPMLQDQKS
jgi:hypothetical protein